MIFHRIKIVEYTQTAEDLGVSRRTLSMLVNGHLGLSAEMALRLSKALGTTPELWLNIQQSFDLWEARQKTKDIRDTIMRKADEQIKAGYVKELFNTKSIILVAFMGLRRRWFEDWKIEKLPHNFIVCCPLNHHTSEVKKDLKA